MWARAWGVDGDRAACARERWCGDGEDAVMPCLIALFVWFASAIGIGWLLARAAALADRRAPHPPARPSAPDDRSNER